MEVSRTLLSPISDTLSGLLFSAFSWVLTGVFLAGGGVAAWLVAISSLCVSFRAVLLKGSFLQRYSNIRRVLGFKAWGTLQ